ncbi:MAG: type II toxin-antitoxin system VapC family toxin [Gammaproteobacteria bacterium]|nr:type II toxin-antitoxin system VapC family toxin [Gammaproteobacteria bacterium]
MTDIFAVDTNIIVAGLLSWHEHHAAARSSLNNILSSSALLVVPSPALIEAYAVITRLPAPHRLSSQDAHEVLYGTFYSAARIVALDESEIWGLLGSLDSLQVTGGRSYDAHIVACAIKGRADCLLTFNTRDFEPLARNQIEIRNPLRIKHE